MLSTPKTHRLTPICFMVLAPAPFISFSVPQIRYRRKRFGAKHPKSYSKFKLIFPFTSSKDKNSNCLTETWDP